jgi:ankyrin repeat protein
MKHLLLTTIAAVLVVGCATTQQPEPPTAKAPDISIHFAAIQGNIEAVKQAIDDGADVNAKDGPGWTPLHLAAHGNKEVVELLIVEGANVNAKNVDGLTPLFGAAVLGKNEIVELLIAKGADVNAKNDDGKTSLDWATHPDNPNASAEITALLRKHGGKTGEELKAEGN